MARLLSSIKYTFLDKHGNGTVDQHVPNWSTIIVQEESFLEAYPYVEEETAHKDDNTEGFF